MATNETYHTCPVCKFAGIVQTTIHHCTVSDKDRMRYDISQCMGKRNYMWAAVLWRRLEDIPMAEYCESMGEYYACNGIRKQTSKKAKPVFASLLHRYGVV